MSKRGPLCQVCKHRERAAIDLALANGVSGRAVAARYGVSHDAVHRHRTNHLTAQLKAKLLAGPDLDIDLHRLRETESQSLLMHLVALRGRLLHCMDIGEEAGDGQMVSKLAGLLHKNLELTGRLLGDLAVGSTTTNNILVAPAYIELRIALMAALSAFPDAKAAVAAALHSLEHKAAEQVRADTREFAKQPPQIAAIPMVQGPDGTFYPPPPPPPRAAP
jgi:hypothetical protein